MEREKYYFYRMEKWLTSSKELTDKEIKNGYILDEYGEKHVVVPLSKLKQYLENNPDIVLYEEELEYVDGETKDFIIKNKIPTKKTYLSVNWLLLYSISSFFNHIF